MIWWHDDDEDDDGDDDDDDNTWQDCPVTFSRNSEVRDLNFLWKVQRPTDINQQEFENSSPWLEILGRVHFNFCGCEVYMPHLLQQQLLHVAMVPKVPGCVL